jgi:hypothetical protein
MSLNMEKKTNLDQAGKISSMENMVKLGRRI